MTVDTKPSKNSAPSELSASFPAETNGHLTEDPATYQAGTPPEDESWFASTETRRLPLGVGRWVEIKDELTYREAGMVRGVGIHRRENTDGHGDQDYYINTAEFGLAKIKMWLVDWNARDRNGPIPCTAANIEALTEKQAEEILDAIRAHEAVLENRPNVMSSPATKS